MTNRWKYFLSLLALTGVAIWLALIAYPDKKLHLVACDVGQGDAILAIYGNTQILVDGGPDTKVLDCLSKHLPFWDREIELVVLTHPQTDHFRGLIEVFKRYNVQVLLATQLDSSSQDYKVLKNVVGGSGVRLVNPTTGMVIRFGSIQLDILHPAKLFLEVKGGRQAVENKGGVLGAFNSSTDPNDFSIVAILGYKDFDALLTGDIQPPVTGVVAEKLVVSNSRTIEYIKIPHHGSKNGLTKELLEATAPEVAVISVGANNRYGHPHKEVIKLLTDREIKILRTDEVGDVEVITDGRGYWVEE